MSSREPAPFEIRLETPLSPEQAWARLTDWPAHGRFVPLTTITAPSTTSVGTVFVARTALGPVGFDDRMEVVAWEPPAHYRIEKRGRAVRGWAEVDVRPAPGDRSGSQVTWREVAIPAGLPGFAGPAAAAVGRLVFGRVVRRLLEQR